MILIYASPNTSDLRNDCNIHMPFQCTNITHNVEADLEVHRRGKAIVYTKKHKQETSPTLFNRGGGFEYSDYFSGIRLLPNIIRETLNVCAIK